MYIIRTVKMNKIENNNDEINTSSDNDKKRIKKRSTKKELYKEQRGDIINKLNKLYNFNKI